MRIVYLCKWVGNLNFQICFNKQAVVSFATVALYNLNCLNALAR